MDQPEFVQEYPDSILATWFELALISIYFFDIITTCDKFWHSIKFHRSQQFAFLFLKIAYMKQAFLISFAFIWQEIHCFA